MPKYTVAQLIERLKALPQDLPVVLNCNTEKLVVNTELGDDGYGNDKMYCYIDESNE